MQPTADRGPKPGDVIEGRYVLRDRIGEGGMGSVFLANQPGLERMVAVKVLHPELADWPEHARRLRDEARNACRVRSSNCVGVIDCGSLPDGAPYIVMEYVPGRSLGQVIAEEAIPLARAVDLMEQILAALGAAHDAGVIHGDVKSDNFLVETSGGRDHVTLIDFGLARVVDAPHEIDVEDGEVMVSGTPEYMAPEVVAGDPPVRASDLYAAGVILYELLTGVTPFGGGTPVAIMLRHAREAAVPPSLRAPELDLPPALDRVVLRALHKSPAARFPDAAAFARELRAAASAPRAPAGRPEWRDHPAMPESPTANYSALLPRRRIARGSDCGGVVRGTEETRLRGAIGDALATGDVAQIANRYLELAHVLGGERRFAAAARELQEGIDVLTAGRAPGARGVSQPVSRLVVALAAVRDEALDAAGPARRRARR